jgi:putative DNA primase/helicase
MSGIRITRVRKASNGLLCKRIALGTDGGPVSDGSPCRMWVGTATRVALEGASGLADLIAELDSSEALILGDHVAEDATIRLVKDSKADPAQGLYGRTLSTFRFRPGEPAVVLLDFDRKGMPQAVADRLAEVDGFEGAVAELLPDLGTYARVIRASTSAGLYNQETGQRFTAGGGLHLYLLVMDGADIPRFLRDFQMRAWLAGFGWIMVAGRGALLTRSIVDITVGSPERLVFEGPPLVVAPLAQDQAERRPIAHDGELIDTRIACPPLTEAERRQFEELVAAAKAAAKPTAETAIEAAAGELAEKRSIAIDKARAVVAASTRGELLSWDSVHFDNPDLDVVTVADILTDPAKYHGETLADPVEGRDYGLRKCKLYFNGGGDVRINSFAHGGNVYQLRHCPTYIALRIEEAGEAAPDVLARLAPFAGGIDAVTRERLRDLAAKVGKVGKRAVNEIFKQAQAKARKEEKERRAREAPRGDGKPKEARQRLDLLAGERPATLRRIEAALRKPENVRTGAVLSRGQAQAVLRFATDPVKLRAGRATIELPTGSAYLAPARPEHLQAQLDQLFAFYKFNSDGEDYPTDCPSDLARYVLANASLLPVMSISRTPVIRADGCVIETAGYDVATGIVFAPDASFPPVPVNPTQADAAQALAQLRHPFRGFPFVTETDRDAVVAEILTLFTRHLVPRAPAFVHNAVEAGSGKTKLFDTVSSIVIGTAAPLLNAEVLRDETELRKLLTTLTLGAAPFAVFDNAARGEMLTSPGLANYLTATVYGDRLLGANEEVKAPTVTTIGITGNAIEIAGDLTRRMLRIDLDAKCERPETRDFDFDCEAEARRDRGRLVVAALTILRAHALAGWPQIDGRASLGSFEDWDRLVASAIAFAGGADIVELMEKTRTTDPERDSLAEVLAMLKGIGAIPGHGMKAGEIIAAVRQKHEHTLGDEQAEAWMDIIRRLGKDGVAEPRRLGRFLKKNAGRLVRGMRLTSAEDSHDKVFRYYVENVPSAGYAGYAGSVGGQFQSGENNFRDREGVRKKDSIRERYRADPAKPANPASERWEAII